MVELKVRIGPKGQIVIPKLLRDHFKLHIGSEIILSEKPDGIFIKSNTESAAETFLKIAESVTNYTYDKKMFDEMYEERWNRAKK